MKKRLPSIPYIGGKNRVAAIIGRHLRATGADVLVDGCGGSGSIITHGGFVKRVYNDVDGDMTNLFRVISGRTSRRELLAQARWMPGGRRLYDDWRGIYVHGGNSFCLIADPVQRALATLYRLNYAYGGKIRSGGFLVSFSEDRREVKEPSAWFSRLRRMVALGEHWRNTVIEELPYQQLIHAYGRRPGVVLYFDPPYFGTENYYSRKWTEQDHIDLASALSAAPAPAAVSYYDCPQARALYPEERWEYLTIGMTKNVSNGKSIPKPKTVEVLIIKK